MDTIKYSKYVQQTSKNYRHIPFGRLDHPPQKKRKTIDYTLKEAFTIIKPYVKVRLNEQFKVVNQWLVEMQEGGVFKRFGLEVYNCCERSGLRAFPHVSFDEAVKDAQGDIEQNPSLQGWYEK